MHLTAQYPIQPHAHLLGWLLLTQSLIFRLGWALSTQLPSQSPLTHTILALSTPFVSPLPQLLLVIRQLHRTYSRLNATTLLRLPTQSIFMSPCSLLLQGMKPPSLASKELFPQVGPKRLSMEQSHINTPLYPRILQPTELFHFLFLTTIQTKLRQTQSPHFHFTAQAASLPT